MIGEFLVLACSDKQGAKCLAGVWVGDSKLIRPVGSEPGGAVSKIACQPTGLGRPLKPLDIVQFELSASPVPKTGQPENFRIEGGVLKFIRTAEMAEVRPLLEKLAIEGESSWLLSKESPAVPHAEVLLQPDRPSLALIKPKMLRAIRYLNYYGRTAYKLDFLHQNRHHSISLSDHSWRFERDGFIDESYLLISLGEELPQKQAHWKLVAGVIPV